MRQRSNFIQKNASRRGQKFELPTFPSNKDDDMTILQPPPSKPISQEHLVAEVKGIYAGLVLVESKCIELDKKQATLDQTESVSRFDDFQWHALILLHRTLLHEHHDFFLASQHPSSSVALRKLATKYAMAARMWKHGIHSFLDLLLYRLPRSNDHFQMFLIIAYSLISTMLETVPAFRENWVEMLGDLARYKYAVETDVEGILHWGEMSSDWYLEAAKTQPTTGRLYHHLGKLAQPKGIKALFYYTKSLCVRKPFQSTSQSILPFLQLFLKDDSSFELPPFQAEYLKFHGLLLSDELDQSEDIARRFPDLLALHISQKETIDTNPLSVAWQMAIVNIAAMLGYGLKKKLQITRFSLVEEDIIMVNSEDEDHWDSVLFLKACYLHNLTAQVALSVKFCHHMRPFLHVTLLFLYKMVQVIGTHKVLDFPWQLLVTFLNDLLDDLPNCSLMAKRDSASS